MKSPDKSEIIAVRLEPATKKRAEIVAKKEGRSLSNWVRELIVERLGPLTTRKPKPP